MTPPAPDVFFFFFSCFLSADWSFAIVRAGCSTCKPDPNGVHTVANAWAGGIQHVGQSQTNLSARSGKIKAVAGERHAVDGEWTGMGREKKERHEKKQKQRCTSSVESVGLIPLFSYCSASSISSSL